MKEGTLIRDRYKVLSLLGKGGAAAVYGVLDTSTSKKLALKKLDLPRDELSTEHHELRFRREFHTMAGLVHPNIVEVYDYAVSSQGPFYTMELLEGQDLRAMNGCSIETACRALRDVASALALLHARRLLHRDVGPRNVRCSGDGAAKLIDFGVLATTGSVGDVAGTPPCMPPEALRFLPLDHKADLFGLGALAYWLLTGRHAYPAKTLFDLEPAWEKRPPRPSELRPDVPSALDDLVLSLLSLDPLGRPARAAEVIDRLVAIAGLDPTTESEVEAGHGYLLSAALVGRQDELSQIRAAVEKTTRGEGSVVLIEAPLGEGKTRLLRESCLEAQLAGMGVVFASIDPADRGPYGLLREITRGLVKLLPNEIPRIARPRASILGRVLPDVLAREEWAGITIEPLAGDPRQDRLRIQAALIGFFNDVAARHRLAILVDDVQRADEGSAAVLASLAHSARERSILLALTLASDEPVHAPAAVRSLQQVAERIRLQGLSIADVELLVGALFADVPHAGLVRWMHGVAGGNPLRLLDLARHLIDRGIIRYAFGLWTIPDELDVRDLPPGLPEAMDRKIASLKPRARALAEALSVCGGELPLRLCVALGDVNDESQTFGSIDELVFEEVLIGAGDRYRFRHEGLREALLRGLGEARKRALHLRAGQALLALGEVGIDREAEVGWHLYHGGETSRAAPLLLAAARRLYEAQSFRDAVPLLEASLGVFEEERGTPAICLEIRHMLLTCGVMFDRAVVLRYADKTFEGLRHHAGVDIAERVSRLLGRKIGLVLGLLVMGVRFWLTPRSRRGPGPIEALTKLGVLLTATASAYSLAFDFVGLRRLLRHTDMFRAFPNRIPYASYLLCESLLAIPLGRWRTVKQNATRCLEIATEGRSYNPLDRKNGLGAARWMLASALASDHDPAFENELAELKKLDLRFFDVSSEVVRLFYHRLRGEEEEARALESKVEIQYVQLGSMWLLQSQLPWVSSFGYALTRDVLGLKRCIQKLDRLCKQGYAFEPFLDIARGEYYRERGQLDAAHAALSRAVAALPEEELFRRQRACTALAEVLLAQGKRAEARALAEQALAIGNDPEMTQVTWRVRCARLIALVMAASGEHEAAARRVDDLIRELGYIRSPTMSGALHETRAHLALLSGDRETYAAHLAETEKWFRGSRNPALVARYERLVTAGTRGAAKLEAGTIAEETVTQIDQGAYVAAALAQHETLREKASRALDLLLAASSGADGHLYLFRRGGLELITSSSGAEPPSSLEGLLQRAVETADEEGATVVHGSPSARDDGASNWMPIVLATGGDAGPSSAAPSSGFAQRLTRADTQKLPAIVGAVAVVQGAIPLEPPDPSLVGAIARELGRSAEAL